MTVTVMGLRRKKIFTFCQSDDMLSTSMSYVSRNKAINLVKVFNSYNLSQYDDYLE